MAYTQNEVNQLVKEAAQQAGGTLSYADAVRAAANLGIPASQISAAASTGLLTGAPAPAAAEVVMPTTYDQAYVNQLVQEAATQAGGTLSYADTVNAAQNLGIPLSMINAAMSGGAITGGPATTTTTTKVGTTKTNTGTVTGLPTGYDQAYINRLIGEAAKQAGGTLSYADAARALTNLGVPLNMLNSAMGSGYITEGVNPFANATQGMQGNTRGTYTSIPIGVSSFNQNFQNYMNTPLGAQYNPGVTGGVSPYGAVMNQMQDFRNPYAGVTANQPMGGYNPNIYDAGLYDRVVQERAAKTALQNATNTGTVGGEGGGGGDSGYDSSAVGTGEFSGFTSADMEAAGMPSYATGGLISQVAGADPAGPDEGQINAQKGEYVIKKSSVNKYGKGLLDMINEGKIPAKKIKSLLD